MGCAGGVGPASQGSDQRLMDALGRHAAELIRQAPAAPEGAFPGLPSKPQP